MTLPTPPRYVVLPQDVIEQAYAGDKPKRALLASFTRILSLAWEAKYQKTPALNETELMEFLKLSRRQYFEQKAEMEAERWLCSSHPRAGFVQFDFRRSISEKVVSAENRIVGAENRTSELRIEEEDLINSLNTESSSILPEESEVRKTAPTNDKASKQLVTRLISSLYLVFDPMEYGLLEMRPVFLNAEPNDVLGWVAKAYQDRVRLKQGGGPIGLIVAKLSKCEKPHPYAVEHATEILPEKYLEKVGLLKLACGECGQVFTDRGTFETHMNRMHPAPEIDEEPEAVTIITTADSSVLEPINGSMNAQQAWQSVLGQLQMEMPRSSFDTWVRDTKVIRFDGNTLTVSGGMNAFAVEWLESRLTSTVERLLVGTLNLEVRVKFVLMQDSRIEQQSAV